MEVSELMTPDPRTLGINATVRDAVQLLAEYDIRHLPILEGRTLAGIISDRDLRELIGIDDPDERAARLDAPVAEMMTSNVMTVTPDDEVAEAIDLMLEHRLGAVVVQSEGEVVGVVSYVDILREARALL